MGQTQNLKKHAPGVGGGLGAENTGEWGGVPRIA